MALHSLSPTIGCRPQLALPLRARKATHSLRRLTVILHATQGSNGALLAKEDLTSTTTEEQPETRSGVAAVEANAVLNEESGASSGPKDHSSIGVEGQQAAKQCKRCGEVKPFSDFLKSSLMADGHDYYCKPCRNSIYLGVKHSEPEDTESPPEVPEGTKRRITHKVCRLCGHDKPMDDFMPNRRLADGRDYYCRPCRFNPYAGAHSRGL